MPIVFVVAFKAFKANPKGRDLWDAFVLKTPPASRLILKAAGLEKGSGVPNKTKAGSITKAQVREIAETKMPDLNANDVEAAMKIIEGTARQMGITVSA